jgi:hypothetical protein
MDCKVFLTPFDQGTQASSQCAGDAAMHQQFGPVCSAKTSLTHSGNAQLYVKPGLMGADPI